MEYKNKRGYIFTVNLVSGEWYVEKTREDWMSKDYVVFQEVTGGYDAREKAEKRLADMARRYNWKKL